VAAGSRNGTGCAVVPHDVFIGHESAVVNVGTAGLELTNDELFVSDSIPSDSCTRSTLAFSIPNDTLTKHAQTYLCVID